MTPRILVFGSEGQVGKTLMARAAATGLDIVGCRRADADITASAEVRRALETFSPTLVVNAAAYTAVDDAEDNVEDARRGNVTGPLVLARETAAASVPLIHLSTDYVFDGTKPGAYLEADPTHPIGVYGATKAEGEECVRQNNPRHLIVRTSWVYSIHGKNFLKTIARLAQQRTELSVVSDQYGCPTSAIDLADGILAATQTVGGERDVYGTYHLAGQGDTSWFGFAGRIAEQVSKHTGRATNVVPIDASQYPSRVRRPANSILDSGLFERTFGFRAERWEKRTRQTVDALFEQPRSPELPAQSSGAVA